MRNLEIFPNKNECYNVYLIKMVDDTNFCSVDFKFLAHRMYIISFDLLKYDGRTRLNIMVKLET